MENTYIWEIIPTNQPTVTRNCQKCGGHSEFQSSDHFRVNANSSHIDVWLIYQCKKCNTTWNMEILSRVKANTIDKELYTKFLTNDRELAQQYTFDVVSHNRNHSVLNYEDISYNIYGETMNLSEQKSDVQLKIICPYILDIRLDKILSSQFHVSREYIKQLSKAGKIIGMGIKDISKAKVKKETLLTIKVS